MFERLMKPASGNSGHKRSRTKGSSSRSKSGTNSGVNNSISFLFVVNELHVHIDYIQHDRWGNTLPPTAPQGYDDEEPSVVFRCRDGVVSEARNYMWGRSPVDGGGLGTGNIFIMTDLHSGQQLEEPEEMPVHNACTIFSSNPHLPIIAVKTDATIYRTMYHGSNEDCVYHGSNNEDCEHVWATPQFTSRESDPGVSEVVLDANQGRNYVTTHNPTWIPSLVPATYKISRNTQLTASKGLSGEIATIIGLMAFYDDYGSDGPKTNELFGGGESSRGRWHHYRWRGSGKPSGYATCENQLRGFLVHVCLDDIENPTCTSDHLRYLERHMILVHDNQ